MISKCIHLKKRKCVTYVYLFSDRMAEIIKQEVDVKESEITSTVEDTCFVNIPEVDISWKIQKYKVNFIILHFVT